MTYDLLKRALDARVSEVLPEPTPLDRAVNLSTRLSHPVMSHGDIGAATGGVLAACILAAFSRGYAPASEAVIWAAADGATRAAARITRPAP